MNLSESPRNRTVLLVLALVALLCTLVHLTRSTVEVSEAPVQVQPPGETLPGERGQTEIAAREPPDAGDWGRDPFALSDYLVRLRKAPAEPVRGQPEQMSAGPSLEVRAVLVGASQQVAVVDDRVVQVGDWIEGNRVVKISLEQVVLDGSAGRRVLPVPGPKAAVTSMPAVR
jgi:hypothetical protein